MWAVDLTSPAEEVTFEIRFYLPDAPRGGTWVWPVKDNGNGGWTLEPQKGSGTGQPPVTW